MVIAQLVVSQVEISRVGTKVVLEILVPPEFR